MNPEDLDRLTFRQNERAARYEALLDETLAAVVEYSIRDRTMIIVHTGTKPEYRGQGIAARITAHVLDDARARDLRIVPECPYTAEFIANHEEYSDVVS